MPRATQKQLDARFRNRRIFELRGMWSQAYARIQNLDRRLKIQELIDEELKDLGAEPEGKRRADMHEHWKNAASDPQ